MTAKQKYPNPNSLNDHLLHITALRAQLTEAETALGDALLQLHDTRYWQEVTYAQLATVMGCSRQAVQQRVHRLLEGAGGRRRRPTPITHPGQLTIDGKRP